MFTPINVHDMSYDNDLCCNENCEVRLSCQRYRTFKFTEWHHCYVMLGCIGFQLLKEVL